MVKCNGWHIPSQIGTDSVRELQQHVYTCGSKEESENRGCLVCVCVCGRTEIRPVWFVLQSQIKKNRVRVR